MDEGSSVDVFYLDLQKTFDKIQRRATKLIPGLRDLRYEERLKECGLTTLETRILRGGQIEVFTILNGYIMKILILIFFSRN